MPDIPRSTSGGQAQETLALSGGRQVPSHNDRVPPNGHIDSSAGAKQDLGGNICGRGCGKRKIDAFSNKAGYNVTLNKDAYVNEISSKDRRDTEIDGAGTSKDEVAPQVAITTAEWSRAGRRQEGQSG